MRILHHTRTVARAASGWLWAGIALLLLGACGDLQTGLAPDTTQDHAYIATIDITDDDTRQAIEAAHGGTVVVWRPEAGFAILSLPEDGDGIALLSREGAVSRNRGVVTIPTFDEQTLDGAYAWAGGVNAWAGGISAWAGGVSAWAGGVSAWAGGVDNPFPGNENYWQQIRLGQAQDVATRWGTGITIAIIDTGLDLNHVGFAGRLTPSTTWLDLVDGDAYPHDGYVVGCTLVRGKTCRQTGLVKTGDGPFFGHGTAVAGVALQAAPNTTILPIRVLNSWGYGDASNVAIAIDHAIQRGADVINLSLGTFEPVAAIDQMLAFAQSRGVIVVAASGNTGNTSVMYPARTAALADYPLAISVGSVNGLDQKSWFSTYGAGLEMLAPGESVTTLYPGDAMATAHGTSFSAPWISGVAALILAEGAQPSTTPNVVDASVNINGANPGMGGLLGKGRLDSLTAVRTALGL